MIKRKYIVRHMDVKANLPQRRAGETLRTREIRNLIPGLSEIPAGIWLTNSRGICDQSTVVPPPTSLCTQGAIAEWS